MQLQHEASDSEQLNTSKAVLVIVNDEPFSRECLVQAMRGTFPHNVVIGISVTGELRQVSDSAVALVLLRIQFNPAFKSQLAAEIEAVSQQCPDAPIAVLSPYVNAISIGEAIELGVCGIIPVSTPFKVAVAALQLVMAGGTYYPYPHNGDLRASDDFKAANHIMAETSEPFTLSQPTKPSLTLVEPRSSIDKADENGSHVIFTAREAEVLEALQRGWSNKWIAHSLQLSENTIKVHIQRIMRKLHATNRTEAVVRHRQLNSLR